MVYILGMSRCEEEVYCRCNHGNGGKLWEAEGGMGRGEAWIVSGGMIKGQNMLIKTFI